jgi:hypothetical protein
VARVFLVERRTWTVQEVIDRSTNARALIFSSVGIGRRVAQYPPDWRELSDALLYGVSLGR